MDTAKPRALYMLQMVRLLFWNRFSTEERKEFPEAVENEPKTKKEPGYYKFAILVSIVNQERCCARPLRYSALW